MKKLPDFNENIKLENFKGQIADGGEPCFIWHEYKDDDGTFFGYTYRIIKD